MFLGARGLLSRLNLAPRSLLAGALEHADDARSVVACCRVPTRRWLPMRGVHNTGPSYNDSWRTNMSDEREGGTGGAHRKRFPPSTRYRIKNQNPLLVPFILAIIGQIVIAWVLSVHTVHITVIDGGNLPVTTGTTTDPNVTPYTTTTHDPSDVEGDHDAP